jgi:CelD/BcsL family acetyltransferase involved in cellulose biosynthesis
MTIQREVISSIASAEAFKEDWERLLCICPQATVFDSFGWVQANLAAFPNSQTSILLLRELGAGLLGVIPLVVRRGRRYLRERRWIEFAGQPYADYASCLVLPGAENAVACELIDFCASTAADWDGVFLDRFRADSTFVDCVSAAATKRRFAAVTGEDGRIRRLTKLDYENNSAGDASSKSLKKARTRLAEHGAVSFEIFSHPDQIAPRLNTFFDWHVTRFAAKGLRSPLAEAPHREFYRQMVALLAPQERIWLSVLSSAAQPVAMRLSPVFNRTVHLYSTCFDASFSKYSPSMLHLQMLLEHAFRSGIDCIDFGLGESPQKDFAGHGNSQPLVTLEIYKDKLALLEQQSYQTAERVRSRSQIAARAGKALRRIFPYDVR